MRRLVKIRTTIETRVKVDLGVKILQPERNLASVSCVSSFIPDELGLTRGSLSARTLPPKDTPNSTDPSRRVRVPSLPDLEATDEAALNAAAAREVSREMDALAFNPPPPPPLNINRGILPPTAPLKPSPPEPVVEPLENVPSPRIPMAPASNNDSPLVPPQISFGDRSTSSISSGGNSPYRTPTETPTRTPNESPYRPALTTAQLSTMSITAKSSSTSLSSPLPPGTRTISAAAFKRPSPRLPSSDSIAASGIADISPLTFKKRPSIGAGLGLPSSPRQPPSVRTPSGAPPPSSYQSQAPPSPIDGSHRRVPSSVPQNTFADEDDQFDYIAAYVNNAGADAETPSQPGGNRIAGGGPGGGGYAQGRFATNLDEGSLR